jgi:hypothetical protein
LNYKLTEFGKLAEDEFSCQYNALRFTCAHKPLKLKAASNCLKTTPKTASPECQAEAVVMLLYFNQE